MKIVNLKTDEVSLITALKMGDRDAFTMLVSRFRKPIIRICRGYVGSKEDAEDIAQEVFVELFRSVEKFKGEAALTTWIYRIAINRSLNFIRDNRKKFILSRHSDAVNERFPEKSDGSENSDSEAINYDHKKALHQALDRLPENQRTAFILNKYEDIPYKEIGEIMKLSQSSVESLIFRAKQNLQKSLYNYFQENIQ